MKGDFSRFTFDPDNRFVRVLMQQGRVQLDADWNEQTAIFWHYLRTLVTDLVGPHWGPKGNSGFQFITELSDITDRELSEPEEERVKALLEQGPVIGKGHYYVGGILCDNSDYTSFPEEKLEGLEDENYLVYLDVWERHITYVQNDHIREVALRGPDTATRSQVVCAVRIWRPDDREPPSDLTCEEVNGKWPAWIGVLQPENRGRLKARTKITDDIDTTDACITPPESRYRGTENQLYRVEIHKGGEAWNGELGPDGKPAGNFRDAATFKFSRDNGFVVFPLHRPATFPTEDVAGEPDTVEDKMTVTLEHLGRDSRFTLAEDDWVELVDDAYALKGLAEPLWQVVKVDRVTMEVTLRRRRPETPDVSHVGANMSEHPLLRRWDHKAGIRTEGGLELQEGAAVIVEGTGEKNWLKLEDGIQIQFQQLDAGASYRTGDYWLIPARTATGDIEWPGLAENDEPEAQPPHGVEHYYAPLAIIVVDDGSATVDDDCRCLIEPAGRCE
jgi:hypothetical protein